MQTLKDLLNKIDVGTFQLLAVLSIIIGILLLPIDIAYRLIILGVFVLGLTLTVYVER